MKQNRSRFVKGTVKRLIQYIFKNYQKTFIFVIVCIIISAISGVFGSVFIKIVVDDYVTPMLKEQNPIYDGLLRLIFIMGGIYFIGVLANYFYNRLIVNISQGVLKDIRDEMFNHMQTLPISYFDENSHGDIMSHYTNDTDALEQMIAQSLPQLLASFITIITVFIAMVVSNWMLTLVVIFILVLMLITTKTIAGKSGKYFMAQQKAVGKVNRIY